MLVTFYPSYFRQRLFSAFAGISLMLPLQTAFSAQSAWPKLNENHAAVPLRNSTAQLLAPSQNTYPQELPLSVEDLFTLSASTCLEPLEITQDAENIAKLFLNLDEKRAVSRKSTIVSGVELIDEPSEWVEAFRELTTPTLDIPEKESIDPIDLSTRVQRECKKVLCAVESIFGKSEGPLLLFLLRKYRYNASHLIQFKQNFAEAQPWKAEDLWLLGAVLNTVPTSVLKTASGGKAKGHPLLLSAFQMDAQANAVIRVNPKSWSKQSPHQKLSLIIHEIGHGAAKFSLDLSVRWGEVSGWNLRNNERTHKKSVLTETQENRAISAYAKTNPEEDFAESFSAYLLAPQALRSSSISRYNYFRDVIFSGQEFERQGQCDQSLLTSTSRLLSRLYQNGKLDSNSLEKMTFPDGSFNSLMDSKYASLDGSAGLSNQLRSRSYPGSDPGNVLGAQLFRLLTQDYLEPANISLAFDYWGKEWLTDPQFQQTKSDLARAIFDKLRPELASEFARLLAKYSMAHGPESACDFPFFDDDPSFIEAWTRAAESAFPLVNARTNIFRAPYKNLVSICKKLKNEGLLKSINERLLKERLTAELGR